MATDSFSEMKKALKNGETTFTIGEEGWREFCITAKYGDTNLIYGISNYSAENELPRITPNERPRLIAMSDDKGRDIVLISRYPFLDHGNGQGLDKRLEPHFVENVVEELNKQLTETIVEAFKDSLTMDDFDETAQEAIETSAQRFARENLINGERVNNEPLSIVTTEQYIAIRSGQLFTTQIANEFCEENAFSLMREKRVEELMQEDILDKTEKQLAEVVRESADVKYLTLNFERGGVEGSAKITPETLKRVLQEYTTFSSWNFANSDAFSRMAGEMLGCDTRSGKINGVLDIYDIESVTYGKKMLYERAAETPAAEKTPSVKKNDNYER